MSESRKRKRAKFVLAASLASALCAVPAALVAQKLDPASFMKPPTDSWPTYSGDFSGQRYSPLTQVNRNTVKALSLAWTSHITAGAPGSNAPGGVPTIVGGEAAEPVPVVGPNGGARIVGRSCR